MFKNLQTFTSLKPWLIHSDMIPPWAQAMLKVMDMGGIASRLSLAFPGSHLTYHAWGAKKERRPEIAALLIILLMTTMMIAMTIIILIPLYQNDDKNG